MREPACHRLESLLEDIESGMAPMLDRPYAFFGHSMGSTVAYELTRRQLASGQSLPRHLFFSGRSAPQLPSQRPPIHALPHEEFIETLREFSGTPGEVLQHRELMEMMVPILRADFEALETWQYEAAPPFNIPISAFGGLSDKAVPMENLDAWASCTTARFKRHMFPGGHFFLQQHFPAMLNIVARALENA
jgi:medium-chain acyl-[acyl-carrier-protein] hydrolase